MPADPRHADSDNFPQAAVSMAYPPVPGPDGCGSIPGTGPAPETEQPPAWLTARTALAPGPQEALPSYGTESSRYRSSVQEPQSSLWNIQPTAGPLEALPDTALSVLGSGGGLLCSRPAGPRPAAAGASIAKYQLIQFSDHRRRRRQPVQTSSAREPES